MFDDDNDGAHMILEEEQHFFGCVLDVKEAFATHGVDHILHEVKKDPDLAQKIRAYIENQV